MGLCFTISTYAAEDASRVKGCENEVLPQTELGTNVFRFPGPKPGIIRPGIIVPNASPEDPLPNSVATEGMPEWLRQKAFGPARSNGLILPKPVVETAPQRLPTAISLVSLFEPAATGTFSLNPVLWKLHAHHEQTIMIDADTQFDLGVDPAAVASAINEPNRNIGIPPTYPVDSFSASADGRFFAAKLNKNNLYDEDSKQALVGGLVIFQVNAENAATRLVRTIASPKSDETLSNPNFLLGSKVVRASAQKITPPEEFRPWRTSKAAPITDMYFFDLSYTSNGSIATQSLGEKTTAKIQDIVALSPLTYIVFATPKNADADFPVQRYFVFFNPSTGDYYFHKLANYMALYETGPKGGNTEMSGPSSGNIRLKNGDLVRFSKERLEEFPAEQKRDKSQRTRTVSLPNGGKLKDTVVFRPNKIDPNATSNKIPNGDLNIIGWTPEANDYISGDGEITVYRPNGSILFSAEGVDAKIRIDDDLMKIALREGTNITVFDLETGERHSWEGLTGDYKYIKSLTRVNGGYIVNFAIRPLNNPRLYLSDSGSFHSLTESPMPQALATSGHFIGLSIMDKNFDVNISIIPYPGQP